MALARRSRPWRKATEATVPWSLAPPAVLARSKLPRATPSLSMGATPKPALKGPSGTPARGTLALSVTPVATPLLQVPVAEPSDKRALAAEKAVLPSSPARFQPAAAVGSSLAKLPL